MKLTWTKPYRGIQHMQEAIGGIRQITVVDYGDAFVEVWALSFGAGRIWEATASSASEAQRKGEAFAKQYAGGAR